MRAAAKQNRHCGAGRNGPDPADPFAPAFGTDSTGAVFSAQSHSSASMSPFIARLNSSLPTPRSTASS